jgi:excisionase family DNA binding protein
MMNNGTKTIQSTTTKPEPLLLRVEEAARLLSLSRSTLYEMLSAGEIASVRRGSARRIPMAALHSWINQNISQ